MSLIHVIRVDSKASRESVPLRVTKKIRTGRGFQEVHLLVSLEAQRTHNECTVRCFVTNMTHSRGKCNCAKEAPGQK